MDNANKFFSKFDIDFARHKPMWYGVEIEVPVAANGVGRGTIALNNQPYLLYRITHQIIGETVNWETTGLQQDGQYAITFRDENSNYQNQALPAEAFFGPCRTGHYLNFAIPIGYSGNRTLSFEITNRYLRVLAGEEEYYTVAIVCHGIADWGPLQSSR